MLFQEIQWRRFWSNKASLLWTSSFKVELVISTIKAVPGI
jgi:hypothetical protein